MWSLNGNIWYSEEEYKELESKLRLAEDKNKKYENNLVFKCLNYFDKKEN